MVRRDSVRPTARRSQLETYLDVLKAARKLHKPTLIMYRCNLSWTPLQRCFDTLIKYGCLHEVETDGSRKRYYLSDKGKTVLAYFKKVEQEFPLLRARFT